MKRKRGFTLLELIVVIIIIGVLAALGFTQYTRMIEKGRTAEAKSALGTLRNLQLAYFQDLGVYSADVDGCGAGGLCSGLPETDATCTNTSYYYGYACAATGTCTAARCTGGGKTPNVTDAYTITLDIAGAWGGTAGWY